MDDLSQQLKKILLKATLFLFKGFILIKKFFGLVFSFFRKIFLFFFKISLKLGGKKVILFFYKTYFFIKKGIVKIFLPAKNKYLYPFINKKTTHVIIILLTCAIISENIKLKLTHAQSFDELLGTNSVLSELATEELEDTILIEEKISSSGYVQSTDYLAGSSFGVKSNQSVGGENLEEDQETARILSNSEGLVKPDIITPIESEGTPEEIAPPQESTRTEIVEYTVQAGDVLGAIADKFKISVNTILWANNLNYTTTIRPGDKLKILPQTGVLHYVATGETLGAIANKYGSDINKILKVNNLANANSLKKGQELFIPDGIKPAAPKPITLAQKPASNPYSLKTIFSPSASRSSAKFLWPTPGKRISQYYHLGHHAIDIADKQGTPIYAIEKGQVILSQTGWGGGYGNNLIIDHGGGQKSRYAHFYKLYVKKGDFVEKGQQIGLMGTTGNSTGPHLHIEIIINGAKLNPLSYIK